MATGAEVSSKSRHAITHEGGYSLIFPHTVVKWPSDHLAPDTSGRSHSGAWVRFPEALPLKNDLSRAG